MILLADFWIVCSLLIKLVADPGVEGFSVVQLVCNKSVDNVFFSGGDW